MFIFLYLTGNYHDFFQTTLHRFHNLCAISGFIQYRFFIKLKESIVYKIALVGDSIFDNQRYVGKNQAVIDHLNNKMPKTWSAKLYAQDGAMCQHIPQQVDKVSGCSHLILSIGGNDALSYSSIVNKTVDTISEALFHLSYIRDKFEKSYKSSLCIAKTACNNVFICTIYDSVPNLSKDLKTALALFNERILFIASEFDLPIIDLRVICKDSKCYSDVSVIEPSNYGGELISSAIINAIIESEK